MFILEKEIWRYLRVLFQHWKTHLCLSDLLTVFFKLPRDSLIVYLFIDKLVNFIYTNNG